MPGCPAGFAYLTSNGNSTREAGQSSCGAGCTTASRRSCSTRYSKAIDNAALGGKGQGAAVIAQDWLDLRGERGLSNFDQRHLLTCRRSTPPAWASAAAR